MFFSVSQACATAVTTGAELSALKVTAAAAFSPALLILLLSMTTCDLFRKSPEAVCL